MCTTFTLGAAPAECQIDDLIFSSFVYTPVISAPGAGQIAVNPVSGMSGPELEFSGPFFLFGANRFMNFTIQFDVTAASPAFMIDGSGLSVNTITAVGGIAGIAETANTTPLNITSFGDGAPVEASFDPVSSVHIMKNIVLVTGAQPGVPHLVVINTIGQQFSQLLVVPEPATYLFLGCGLVILPLLARKLIHRG